MVEIKARIKNHENLRNKLISLDAKKVGIFEQKDFFFKVPEGRLKLREVKNNSLSELIYYEREDISGPKSDNVFILKIEKAESLKKILKKILTQTIIVKKIREVYRHEISKTPSENSHIRIHLDKVKNLGNFLELELKTSKRTQKEDKTILENFAEKIGIKAEQLEKLSYADLLKEAQND
jgi:predicted adenylyl cyclase CyaB